MQWWAINTGYFPLCHSVPAPRYGMYRYRNETQHIRAEQAFELAEQGKTVCVISSGDAGDLRHDAACV